MQITLKNVGAIRSATISLNGLAVIAGPNESGKSTVGKTLYTVIKALKEHRELFVQEILRNIQQAFLEISSIIRKMGVSPYDGMDLFNTKPSLLGQKKRSELSELLYKIRMADNIVPDELNSLLQEGNIEAALSIVDKYKTILENNLSENDKNLAIQYITEIQNLLNKKPSFAESFKLGLLKLYKDVFVGQMTNIYTKEPAEICISDELRYKITSNLGDFDMNNIEEQDAKHAVLFSDAVFIETPLITQYGALSKNAPHYWKDLVLKIRRKPDNDLSSNVLNRNIHSMFTKIINAELDYNEDSREFVIVKPNTTQKLVVNNAASGVKEFGILQRMARLCIFSGTNLIILDEPENHLHTEWQVKLAEVIIELVKNGVSVLITSHSPDFIQTLRVEADKSELDENKAKFYLSEGCKKTSDITKYDIIDKTGEEADILENLSMPMDKIYDYIMTESMKQ